MGVAVAALAHQPPVFAMGIDLEQARTLPAEDAALVLSAAERLRLDSHPDPDALATVLWSAKEAAFKAWSTALGGLPDVDPVEIMVVPDDEASLAFATIGIVSSFVVHAAGALAGRVSPIGALHGFVHVSDGWVFSIVTDLNVRP